MFITYLIALSSMWIAESGLLNTPQMFSVTSWGVSRSIVARLSYSILATTRLGNASGTLLYLVATVPYGSWWPTVLFCLLGALCSF